MRSFVRYCVGNPVFVNVLMFLVLVSGLGSLGMMIREVLPSFKVEQIEVQVPYPGAGPEEVEEGIILKIEEAIQGIDGIKKYNTFSQEGLGVAMIDVIQGYDVQQVKDRIADRVNAIDSFPDDAERPIVSELLIKRDTLAVAVTGDVPERQLKELAEEIKDDLLQLDDVSQVAIMGAREYEISIEVSEETLRRFGLTFNDVRQAVAQASQNVPGGELRGEGERIKIRTMGRRYTGKEFEDIVVVTRPDGTAITLDQIATIRDGFTEDPIISTYEDRPAVTLIVYTNDGEDALDVVSATYEYIERRNAELPPTIQIETWADAADLINQRIDLLVRNGVAGLILVFLSLWLFLDLRLSFWVTLGIPISLTGALALMYTFDQSINMISLFAMIMVLGIIVDDAIVVGEAIYVHRRMGQGPFEAAVNGTMEVAMPVVAAVTTTCFAFAPLLFISGVMGKFIAVIPLVVISALLISLIEGLIILPSHLRDLPANVGDEKIPRGILGLPARLRRRVAHGLETFVEKVYRPFIGWVLSWRYVSLAAMFAVLFITFGLIRGGFASFVFFPDIDTSWIGAQVEFPDGTPLERSQEAVERLENGLLAAAKRPEAQPNDPDKDTIVKSLEVNAGAIFGMDSGFSSAAGSHVGEVRVELVDSEERSIYFRNFLRMWEEETGPIAGAVSVNYYGASGGPPGKPIEVWLLGEDLDRLVAAADALVLELSEFDGVYQAEHDFRAGKRELRARLKPEARSLGLTNDMLAQQLRTGYYGDEVLRVQRGSDEVKVWVRYEQDERKSLEDLGRIRIRTPGGQPVPIATVADLSIEEGYTTIRRKDGVRRVAVTAEVDTNVITPDEVMQSLIDAGREDDPEDGGFLARLATEFPSVGYSLEGKQREQAESFAGLKLAFPIAILGIYLIIATLFRSYVQPIVIMITVPFGIIGAVIGHMLLGYELTIMSMFGLVALTGVVVNDAIIFIEAVNERLADGMSFRDSLIDGGARRFRPILLTTITTVGGLLPLMTEKSMQAQFLIPMALSIAAGVAFATALTIGMVPCLLAILNDMRRGAYRLKNGHWPTHELVEPAAHRRSDQGLGDSPLDTNPVTGAPVLHRPNPA
ncbi:MAG: efflux RND transporter permease subunit [Sumerlaeia bacterium]